MGCKCTAEEILTSFIRAQLVMIREDIIGRDPFFYRFDFLKSVTTRCRGNLKLYESLIFTDDQEFIEKIKWNVKEAISDYFSAFWKKNDEDEAPFRINEPQLIKFIDIQFKKFRSGLKFEPIVFFDISPKSFEQFARKNLLDCQEIHKLILSRAKSFVLKVFYQRRWYQNNPDQLIKNTEDIVGDAIVGFNELISKRYIANRRIIKHDLLSQGRRSF